MAEIFPDEGLDYILAIFPKNGANIATLYAGLFSSQTATTVPGRTMVLATSTGITEVAGTGYARVSLAAATWGAISTVGSGRQSTYPQITFPTVGSGGWTTANGFFIATASAAGTCIYAANFDGLTARVFLVNDIEKLTPTIQYDG